MPWSRVNTEYGIHCVLHHPSIDCLPLPASLSSLGRPSCTQFSTFPQLRVNQWIEFQIPSGLPPELSPPDWPPPSAPPITQDHGLQVHLKTRTITASKCIYKLAQSRPPSASPNLHNHGLQEILQTPSIAASKCISKPPQVQPPNLLDHGLRVCTIMATTCISTLAWSRSRGTSLSSLDHGLHVHLQTRTIAASKCIYQLARLRPPNLLDHSLQARTIITSKCLCKLARSQSRRASPSSLSHSLQVHLQTRSITASKCISKLAPARPPSSSPNSLDHSLQGHLYGGTVGVWTYRGNGGGSSDREYIRQTLE